MIAEALPPDDPRLRRLALADAQSVARLLDCSIKTLRRLVKRKEFPAPIQVGGRLHRWKLLDIENHLRACPVGDGLNGAAKGGLCVEPAPAAAPQAVTT